MALTGGRNTRELAEGGRYLVVPVAANTRIFEGSLVVLGADGFAKPAEKKGSLTAAGRAEELADNRDGDAGELSVKISRGAFIWDNDPDNPVTTTHMLKDCYILDDSTVTSVSTGSSRAGKVIGFENGGVAVETL